MRALVTGGGGFLGRYIVEQLLERGDAVTVFARGSYPELVQAGAYVARGDLQDEQAVHAAFNEGSSSGPFDVVFHVAAKAGLWGPWETFYNTNVVGTRNVIAACRAHGIHRLVYTSSPSVVFDNRPHEGCDESLPYPLRYESSYPQTKAMAEQMVLAANGQDGLLTVSLRPHLIWGPRDRHILPRLLARARQGKLVQVGDGTNRVDLTYVEDAARAHLLAAEALSAGPPVAGSAYFISQDEPVNMWIWINDLLIRLGLDPVQRRIPLWLARTAGAALEFVYHTFRPEKEPLLTRTLASELATSHYYDISRAKRELGYTPQWSMEEALTRTVGFVQGTM